MRSYHEAEAKFYYLIGKAISLLKLRQLGEFRRPFEKLPVPNPSIFFPGLPSPIEIKAAFDELAKTVDQSLCEVILTVAVTALEVYLEDVYLAATSNNWGKRRKLENKSALQLWGSCLADKGIKADPFLDVSGADLQNVFAMRHVIVHKGGIIDQQAINDGLLLKAKPGQEISEFLKIEDAQTAIEMICSVVSSLNRQLHQNRP